MAKYARKSNGVSFQPLEARVAPMVIKLAESLERSIGGAGSGGEGDNKQAMLKIAKQIKKSTQAAANDKRR